MSAGEIETRADRLARLFAFVGSARDKGSGSHSETYRRFDVGVLDAVANVEDLRKLESFQNAISAPHVSTDGAFGIVYFMADQAKAEP